MRCRNQQEKDDMVIESIGSERNTSTFNTNPGTLNPSTPGVNPLTPNTNTNNQSSFFSLPMTSTKVIC